jgi:hypothetical protein
MNRFGRIVGGVLLASLIVGCESGIPEGAPKEGQTDPQPPEFKEFMKKTAGKMQNPKKPAAPPKVDAPEKKAE